MTDHQEDSMHSMKQHSLKACSIFSCKPHVNFSTNMNLLSVGGITAASPGEGGTTNTKVWAKALDCNCGVLYTDRSNLYFWFQCQKLSARDKSLFPLESGWLHLWLVSESKGPGREERPGAERGDAPHPAPRRARALAAGRGTARFGSQQRSALLGNLRCVI